MVLQLNFPGQVTNALFTDLLLYISSIEKSYKKTGEPMKAFLSIFICISLVLGCASKNNLMITQKDMSKSMAFIKDKDEIGIINLKGKILKSLREKNTANTSLSWSPDGNVFSYIQSKNGSVYLKLYNPSENSCQNLCNISIDGEENWNVPVLKWSKNGKYIYFSDHSGFYRVDLSGNKELLAPLDAIRDFDVSSDGSTLAYTDGTDLFITNFVDNRINSDSNMSYNFKSVTNDKINHITFFPESTDLLLAVGKNIIVLDRKNNEYRNVQKAPDPIYWLQMDPVTKNIYYLSGVPTIHRELDNIFEGDMFYYYSWIYYNLLNRDSFMGFSYFQFPGEKMKQRVQGHFDLCAVSMNNPEISKIISRRESVTSVMPSLSPEGKYLTIVANSLNSVKQIFIISTKNNSTKRLTKKGIYSFPVWKPL